ncbi:MAG TPA: asparagine synthase (glutamine-hydrolyzing) [Candidatus Acidoferrales bacterium]|nr:asparagine synthase (glutamine-hydrolyzing) [Candidatus Acidoferrales bacterium]
MCGIAGFINADQAPEAELRPIITRMTDTIVYRGPDDSGSWVEAAAGIGLGARRLAILDLSAAGHQPMVSSDGRFVLVFNGELYNFTEIRAELEPRGHAFRGHSDTEVILAAVVEWGIEEAVKRFAGMFAFAIWDRRERALHLARDRMGIKPLYYGWAQRAFLFGSELKALRQHPAFRPEVNRGALALQMRFAYVPQPHAIYNGIFKLPPGCILSLPANSLFLEQASPRPYWAVRGQSAANASSGSDAEVVEQLDQLLRLVVRQHMISDVPLGAFLSGGIDSSMVVALMQAQSSRPVRTFTIGFREPNYNEAEFARAVAGHLGTEHTELTVTPEEAREVIPKLPTMYDEPFADSSQIPTYLVSALARRQVTVSLSGDGGDELFGGYSWYLRTPQAWSRLGRIPRPLRRLASAMIAAGNSGAYNRAFGWLSPPVERFGRRVSIGERIRKAGEVLALRNREELYQYIHSRWKGMGEVVVGAPTLATTLSDTSRWPEAAEFVQRMMLVDQATYLPDDILAKVDRASMAVSLEARVPLLDHRVVEFAARVPAGLKIREGKGKWLLRQVLCRYLPEKLFERPKMGFAMPIDRWLRGPLRDWAEALLDEKRLQREGFLCPGPIRRAWSEHLNGDWNRADDLWNVLMFQAWQETWL